MFSVVVLEVARGRSFTSSDVLQAQRPTKLVSKIQLLKTTQVWPHSTTEATADGSRAQPSTAGTVVALPRIASISTGTEKLMRQQQRERHDTFSCNA